MSILLICNQKDPQPWVQALREKLPNTSIEIYPDFQNADSIDFVLCWKPARGVLQQFPNLRVVQSLGAGVEHIFDSQTLDENIMVSRIVDPDLSNDNTADHNVFI